LNSGWSEPFFIGAVEIRIEADEHQIKFFRDNILVGIIEIEPKCRCDQFNPLDILTGQGENRDTSLAKEITDER
jgi:hypothetical protein